MQLPSENLLTQIEIQRYFVVPLAYIVGVVAARPHPADLQLADRLGESVDSGPLDFLTPVS